jgi:hypothetical protein
MCALAGNYLYQHLRNDQKLSKSICDGDYEEYILWSWSPRWCASPASSHGVARRAGAFVVHGCFVTLRWVSRLPPVMTIQFSILLRCIRDVPLICTCLNLVPSLDVMSSFRSVSYCWPMLPSYPNAYPSTPTIASIASLGSSNTPKHYDTIKSTQHNAHYRDAQGCAHPGGRRYE